MRLFLTLTLGLFALQAWSQTIIDGRVTESQTGNPIADAHVVLLINQQFHSSQITDPAGFFRMRLNETQLQNVAIQVSHMGYENRIVAIHPDSLKGIVLELNPIVNVTDEAVVRATRVSKTLPGTQSTITKKELEKQNLGQDLPYLLNMTPGAVVHSDAGAGIGYTGIRIRGVDPTRINVTINGIPVNDAESQGVFWVNMPDFSSSVENIQIQRGVGTSTNGAAAFGATINLQTNAVRKNPFAEVTYGVGFLQNNWSGSKRFNGWNLNSHKRNIAFGTGLMENNWSFEGRVSQILADGFIDRASSNLQSYYLSSAYYGKKSTFKINLFGGREITYQAWNGIPDAKVRGDENGLKRYYFNGDDDSVHLANSGNRTYNGYTYDNEVDHYTQNHLHAHYTYQFRPNLLGNVSFHSTLGNGYFEQYRNRQRLSDYGLPPVALSTDTITRTDLIRRRWLDNSFTGLVYSLNYTSSKLSLIGGGGYNIYHGKHFGEVIWARFASSSEIRHRYYDNDATKSDFNVYGKANYAISNSLSVFADLQYRRVDYNFIGFDQNGSNVTQNALFNFFNPKGGLTYTPNQKQQFYLTYSRANREPVRNDFTESSPNTRPRHEVLNDFELGWIWETSKQRIRTVAYAMIYKDQLVLNGQINDVGAYTRVNVEDSYRTGVELEYALNINRYFQWTANLALSRNKLRSFTEYVDDYDADFNYLGQEVREYKNTDLAFSPSVVAGSMLRYAYSERISIDWISKYVSRQYLDNTQELSRSLNPFWVNDLRLNLIHNKLKHCRELRFSLLAANVFNAAYEPNGYTYSYRYNGERLDFNYLFPQAGTHFLMQVTLAF